MLRAAFNSLLAVHSRPALLKRLGQPPIFSPCRITPSNYSRFLNGPEYTTIAGKEFVIPVDSMTGQFANRLYFEGLPLMGTFKLRSGTDVTTAFNFDVDAADLQSALRLLPGLELVLVNGSYINGFNIVFQGFQARPDPIVVEDSTLDAALTVSGGGVKWPDPIKKGDRIVDAAKTYAIDEVIEMPDLGGQIMGYRVRAE